MNFSIVKIIFWTIVIQQHWCWKCAFNQVECKLREVFLNMESALWGKVDFCTEWIGFAHYNYLVAVSLLQPWLSPSQKQFSHSLLSDYWQKNTWKGAGTVFDVTVVAVLNRGQASSCCMECSARPPYKKKKFKPTKCDLKRRVVFSQGFTYLEGWSFWRGFSVVRLHTNHFYRFWSVRHILCIFRAELPFLRSHSVKNLTFFHEHNIPF